MSTPLPRRTSAFDARARDHVPGPRAATPVRSSAVPSAGVPAGAGRAGRDVARSPEPIRPAIEERRVLAIVGATRRVGRWAVPRRLVVRAFLGNVTIDLRENPIPDGCLIDVRAHGSSVTIIVPTGTAVMSEVFAVFGNAINQANEPDPSDAADTRVVQVTGSAILGEVRVLVREPGPPRSV